MNIIASLLMIIAVNVNIFLTNSDVREVSSPEYMLACIDAGYELTKEDSSIVKYKNLLDRLSNIYGINQKKVADLIVFTTEKLKKECGVKEKNLTIMEGMNKLFLSKTQVELHECLATYVLIRKGDKTMSHFDTIEGMVGIFKTIGVR